MAPRPDRPDRGAAADDTGVAAAASGQPLPVPLAVIGSRCVSKYLSYSICTYACNYMYAIFEGCKWPRSHQLKRPIFVHTHSILLPGGITTPDKFFATIASKTQACSSPLAPAFYIPDLGAYPT